MTVTLNLLMMQAAKLSADQARVSDIKDIAMAFLGLAFKDDESLTPKKLSCLLLIANEYHRKLANRRLFDEAKFNAPDGSPEYKEIDNVFGKESFGIVREDAKTIAYGNKFIGDFLKVIWGLYSGKSTVELMCIIGKAEDHGFEGILDRHIDDRIEAERTRLVESLSS